MFSKYDPGECDRCGKLHVCTGTVHCPCFEIETPENLLEYLASHFDNCLCPECLQTIKDELGVEK